MSKELQIRRPIVAFIEAINDHNTEEFLATLTDSAVITDEQLIAWTSVEPPPAFNIARHIDLDTTVTYPPPNNCRTRLPFSVASYNVVLPTCFPADMLAPRTETRLFLRPANLYQLKSHDTFRALGCVNS